MSIPLAFVIFCSLYFAFLLRSYILLHLWPLWDLLGQTAQMLRNLLLELLLFSLVDVWLFLCNNLVFLLISGKHVVDVVNTVVAMDNPLRPGHVIARITFHVWVGIVHYVLNNVENKVLVPVQWTVFLCKRICLYNRLGDWGLGLIVLSPFYFFHTAHSILFGHLSGINVTVNDVQYAIRIDIIVLKCLIIS
jgi:hypothetical protein